MYMYTEYYNKKGVLIMQNVSGYSQNFYLRKFMAPTKQKISQSIQKNLHNGGGMLGKHHTIEALQKMSEIHKGKIISEEHKQKLSIAGKKHSKEISLRMSKALKGKHQTKEHIQKRIKSRKNNI